MSPPSGSIRALTVDDGHAVLAAKARPSIRVCMWTCAVVLLTAAPGISVTMTAVFRSTEVIVGMAISFAIHMADDGFLGWLQKRRERMRAGPFETLLY